MPLPSLLLQCGPILALAGLLAYLGGRAGESMPAGAGWVFVAVGIVLLAGLLLFKRVPGWNLVLLLALAFAAGALFQPVIGRGSPWLASLVMAGGIALSIGLAYGARIKFGRLATVLAAALLVYVVGWFAVTALPLGFRAPAIWALPGILLFSLLAVNTLANARNTSPQPDATPLAGDLFIVYFNLWLCGAMIGGFLTQTA